jgi:hypothetical protein
VRAPVKRRGVPGAAASGSELIQHCEMEESRIGRKRGWFARAGDLAAVRARSLLYDGTANHGVFSRLKTSVRNCRLCLAPGGEVLQT